VSVENEHELRRRLDDAVEAITPSPAPVAATVRKGRAIRTRRRIGVAAGLVAVVAVALSAPSLVHQFGRHARTEPAGPVLAVYPPGPHSPRGLIAWGTVNGKRWQIAIRGSGSGPSGQCLEINGQNNSPDCGPAMRASQSPSLPVDFQDYSAGDTSYEYGVVQPDVARVVVALPDGKTLTLHPYRLYGQRWVAFAVPTNIASANAAASSRRSELGYAVPYRGDFVTWLRPGERGPRQATYPIASGVLNGAAWSDVVHVGPWGYCATVTQPGTASDDCESAHWWATAGNTFYGSVGTPPSSGAIIEGHASASVAYVAGVLSDGSSIRARAVDVGGRRFWALAVPAGQRLRRVELYSASGRQVAAQSGAEYDG
jgi:hypothetical protein